MTDRAAASGAPELDVRLVRADFPILAERVHGKPLVYLDNGATSQKPRAVIEAIERFFLRDCSNVHRGLHELSARATEDFERARETVRRFVGAGDTSEIVFTRGTTESINLVAYGWGDVFVGAGDEILLTEMEHHSNIVPWQLLCERRGASIKVAPIDDRGEIDREAFERLLSPRTRLVATTHVSNALGTRNPVEWIVSTAHAAGARVLLDGAQGIVHEPLNLAELGCDFYAFSGHKLYGPTGIGVLYARRELLDAMQPFQGGGEMIRSVTFEKTTFNDPPFKFEAGTPDIAGAIGLAAALDYLNGLGMLRLQAYEDDVMSYAVESLAAVPRVRVIGSPRRRLGAVSIDYEGVHPHDVGTVLDHEGIAVRAGHHCAQPLMHRLGLPATVRASFACYNTRHEVDLLTAGLDRVGEVFPR